MSVQETDVVVTDELSEANERNYWKEQANFRGISYPNNITTPKLKELVKAKIAEVEATRVVNGRGINSLTKLDPKVRENLDKATALVRFRLSVLDPSKQGWTGIRVSAGNDNFTAIQRIIPFNAPVWHAERILVEVLKNMKYQQFTSAKHNRLGNIDNINKPKKLPCFHIEELPPLTEEELKQLAQYQVNSNTGQSEDETVTV